MIHDVLATAHTIAERHNVPAEHVLPLPEGVANHVLALGEHLVLRVPRTPGFEADLRKEAALVPLARKAGVTTPALVEFADPPGGTPYMVLERVAGGDLVGTEPATALLDRLGRELARIHTVPVDGLPGLPRDSGVTDAGPLLERLLGSGHIDAEAADWLRAWCERLAALAPPGGDPVLVHGDIAPQNLLVTPGRDLGGIVDWGDAAVADPAMDFAKLPPWWLPRILDAYQREGGQASGQGWQARVLWHHLTWALGRLEDPVPQPGQRHWTAPPASRLLGLLRLFASNPPGPWADLAPEGPAGGATGRG
ncbi:hypothetical protein GCM10009603_45410 [Nocardiopsis exhalans]